MLYDNQNFNSLEEFIKYQLNNKSPHTYEDEVIIWAIQDYNSLVEFSSEDIRYLRSLNLNPLDFTNHWEVQTWKKITNILGDEIPGEIITCESFLDYNEAKKFYNEIQLTGQEGKSLVEVDCDGIPLEYNSGLNEYSA